MTDALRDLQVLAVDGQASGATPVYGDLIELGWSVASAASEPGPAQSRWIVPRTERKIARAVRELTGWSEACLAESLDERAVWNALLADAGSVAPVPTVIHFARFELRFLQDLHERLAESSAFPLDAICLHAVAQRLFPDLPRRNIRALAGYLGHSPELMRRAAGHVEATVFIWRALVPLLQGAGVGTWSELKAWLAAPAAPLSRRTRREFPLAPERRTSLPDRSGVYRFVRRNGDVVYVGKAVSLKKRVASHFKSRGPTTERALELLTQVHDIVHTETPTLLEAALLECDEIKRLDPPYNVQLRSADRSAWFTTRDFRDAAATPDAAHPIGPLPSRRALTPFAALIELAAGTPASPALRASALAVPAQALPEDELFAQGWQAFASEHLTRSELPAGRRVAAASLALWLLRGRAEPEAAADDLAAVGEVPSESDAPPAVWDLARVRRRLERNLVQCGLLVRRACVLCLLADANVAFRERSLERARALVIAAGQIEAPRDLADVAGITSLPRRRPASLSQRQKSFDAATYDRLRVVFTELRRILDEGGEVACSIGGHQSAGATLLSLLRGV